MTVDTDGHLPASLAANPTLARLRNSLASDLPQRNSVHAACAGLLNAMGSEPATSDTGDLPKPASTSELA